MNIFRKNKLLNFVFITGMNYMSLIRLVVKTVVTNRDLTL